MDTLIVIILVWLGFASGVFCARPTIWRDLFPKKKKE